MSRFIWTFVCRCGAEFADTDATDASDAFKCHALVDACDGGLASWHKRRHDGLLVRS